VKSWNVEFKSFTDISVNIVQIYCRLQHWYMYFNLCCYRLLKFYYNADKEFCPFEYN